MPAAKTGIHKVYVEADENHVAMQKGHAKEMKLINVYETKVPSAKDAESSSDGVLFWMGNSAPVMASCMYIHP